jgi:metal-responsive CopG/Arc/MetJ family transcriptional regulator
MSYAKIKLEKELLERCKQYAKDKGYSSVEEFVAHALEKELKTVESMSEKDEKEITDRLRGLGYIE